LPGTDGRTHALVDPDAPFTVIELFSAHCPCQAIHDERLRALAAAYGARRVAFVVVDSEAEATLARDRAEAGRRGTPAPILVDPGGTAARALGAEFATYTLVVARDGRVVYRGGLDSDRSHLTDGAAPYLHDALDDALAGRPLRVPRTEPMGCPLTLR